MQPAAVAALYCAYFAFVGAFSPYLALWFASLGLSIAQIGVLMSLPQALRIIGPLFWGWLADRTGRHVLLLQASALASLFGVAGIIIVEIYLLKLQVKELYMIQMK